MQRDDDDRPPICPACGVTMGIRDDDGETRYICLECGYPDEGWGEGPPGFEPGTDGL